MDTEAVRSSELFHTIKKHGFFCVWIIIDGV